MEESIRTTEDRDKWRKYVHGVAANSRIEDGYRSDDDTAPPFRVLRFPSTHSISGPINSSCGPVVRPR